MKKLKYILALIITVSVTPLSAKTLKIASTAPDGSYWMKQMKAGAKEIKKKTDGRVKLKFYPGGVMGSEEVVMKKIRIRQLHGAAVSNGVLVKFYPDSQIYGLPMLFNNFEEVDYIRQKYDQKIIKGLDKAGMVSFGLSEGGFAYAMSTKPIKNTEDLLNQKIWTPSNNKQAELSLRAFGISPIPLNIGDVLTGLQTNLIDTIAVSPIAAIALQWHTQIKYITDIPLQYVYATLLIDKKAFKKISEIDQNIIKDVMSNVFEKIDKQNRKDNISSFKALLNQGIKLITPESNNLSVWYKKGEAARDKIKTQGLISDQTFEDVKKILRQYRKERENSGAARQPGH